MSSNLPEATELEYLKYFFDQVSISLQERYFLEEGFELCFQKSIPNSLKIASSQFPTIKAPPPIDDIPPPPKVPDIENLLDKVNTDDYVCIDKSTGENMTLSMLIAKLKMLSNL